MPEAGQLNAMRLSDVRRENAAWHSGTASSLTVVVPFYNNDVAPLARRILSLAALAGRTIELVFVDDGSPERAHADALWAVLLEAKLPALLVQLGQNVGRARVRNVLSVHARTTFLLYLDADMWPDAEDFFVRWFDLIDSGSVDVAYGGRSALKVILKGRDHALHRLMTEERENLPATLRRESPAYHFYSCNFIVRRSILQEFPLDERFTGWGWEDCEWASRVSEKYKIGHEDITASHLGLLTVPQLLSKYRESVGNFKLMLECRSDLVTTTALYKASRVIGRLGVAKPMLGICQVIALTTWLPVAIRMRGLMFYKASLYAAVSHGWSAA